MIFSVSGHCQHISAEVGNAKPDREIFDVTFDALGSLAKESAAMVKDNLASDIEGGANSGIATCWHNSQGRPSGQTGNIVHEISALGELLNLVVI
ncbi:MAG: HAD hydrolase-like protein [Pseudomonadota bacterium]|nr:HAD hydrolase-like protein [Pseudomonadota bacterium]